MKGQSLAQLLSVLVASVAPLSAACGGAAGGATLLPETATCPSFSDTTRYSGVTPAPGVDGVAFASVTQPMEAITPIGTPCKTAKDAATCNANVKRLLADTSGKTGWSFSLGQAGGMTDFGVATRGDDVTVLATLADFKAAIAPIDSPQEAMTMVMLGGQYPSCTAGNVRTDADGFTVRATSGGCGGPEYEYQYKVTSAGAVSQTETKKIGDGDPNCVEGRRPAGLETKPGAGWLVSVVEHLQEIAAMEMAAIWAFDELCADLARHSAPAELRARAEQARADEMQHARIMNRVLRGRGIARTAAKAPSLHAHSLLELAVLNVKEGVVRETYGALVAAHQAAYATDPELRIAFRRIARDEAAHAELSLDIASWLASKLDAKERAIVEAAHQEALACLYDECQRLDPSADVARETGMPSAKAALMMLNGLSSALRLAS